MKLSKSEQTKQFIIEKASPVFNTKGYAGTSMQDIMDVTGLTKGGIYGNYKSKEAIAFATFEYNVGIVIGKLQQAIKTEKNAPGKLHAIIKFYKSYYLDPPIPGGCPLLNTAIEADDTHPALRLKVIKSINLLKDSLVHILKKGQDYKQIKEEVDCANFATVFLATVEGGIMMSNLYQDFKYLKECLAHLSKLIDSIKI